MIKSVRIRSWRVNRKITLKDTAESRSELLLLQQIVVGTRSEFAAKFGNLLCSGVQVLRRAGTQRTAGSFRKLIPTQAMPVVVAITRAATVAAHDLPCARRI